MKKNDIIQKNIKAARDFTGRDKIEIQNLIIKKEVLVKPTRPLRKEMGFDLKADSEDTTLLRKLKDGEVNPFMRSKAIKKKLDTLKILIEMCKSESGRGIVADIYESLVTMIENKYLMKMDEGDLLKVSMEEIHDNFNAIISKYEEIIDLDESLLTGLLYIATSNCALKWKVDDAVS
jgi:hypothetical protein